MSINCTKMYRSFAFTVAVLLAAGMLSSPAGAQDSPADSIAQAKSAIEQASRAGAERDAAEDLAAARSWLAQAEKALAAANSVMSMVATARQKKAREDEVVYFASIARIKGLTAEAKAKKSSTVAGSAAAQKTLADFENVIRVAVQKSDEAGRAKADAERPAREQEAIRAAERQREAELEAKRAAERQMEAEQAARRAAERQREAAEALARKQQLEQMQAKLQALEREKAMFTAASSIPNAMAKGGDGKVVITVLVQSLFSPASELVPASRDCLDGLGRFLKAYPDGKVQVRSFTDDRGTAAANKTVSEKRAQKVRDYLVGSQAIPADRVTAEGMGPADPVATNATDAGRALNRRIEVSIQTGN